MEKFEVFKSEQYRKKFVESVERMAEYVHKNNIPIVVAGGSSAQPAAHFFKLVWKEKYGKQKMPSFYSLGLITTRRTLKGFSEFLDPIHFPEQAKEEIKQRRKKLVERMQKEPVFILEEFAASGKTVNFLRKIFSELGAKKVRVGCIGIATGSKPKARIDVRGNAGIPPFHGQRRLYQGKKIYGKNRMVFKQQMKSLRTELRALPRKTRKA